MVSERDKSYVTQALNETDEYVLLTKPDWVKKDILVTSNLKHKKIIKRLKKAILQVKKAKRSRKCQ